MAGHPAQDRLHPHLQGLRPPQVRQLVQHIPQQRRRRHRAQNGRGFAHRHRAAAKGFDPKAQLRQVLRHLQKPRRIRAGKLNDFRDQQRLRLDPRFRHLPFQPLIDQPLMGRMLIDNHHPGCRLRDDVILMQLRARRPQRPRLDRLRLLNPRHRSLGKPQA